MTLSSVMVKDKKLTPLEILGELAQNEANGYLEITNNSCQYFFYFIEGKISYITNSIAPFERLERHLRYFSHQIKSLTPEIRTQVRLKFDQESQSSPYQNSDYHAICWLVEQEYLTPEQAKIIIESVSLEVMENYLLLTKIESQYLIPKSDLLPTFWRSDYQELITMTTKKLQGWLGLYPQVWSSYQRPYFFGDSSSKNKLSDAQKKQLGSILKGFNFRQLGVLLNQNELDLAKKLYPLIIDGSILLREPQAPFHLLPKIDPEVLKNIFDDTQKEEEILASETGNLNSLDSSLTTKHYHIACVDDSPTILNSITAFLEGEKNVSVVAIDDSAKALMTILKVKPDLILMDVGMPNIDGYQLCSLLRKNTLFKNTPIVMVTGNKGLIDRAKARLSGATDYMTKPFTQEQLLEMVFRYLS
jgi:two-component system, chemotaxis family, response regulator PixG